MMSSARSYSKRVRSDRADLWKSGRPLLTWLDIEITERCNNDCLHCSVNRPAADAEARSREMSAAEIVDIFRQAADLGCLSVRLTGGEPLLREDFEEIYQSARNLGLRVMIFTNATLISPRLASLFARMPPFEKLEVSIYGVRRESYEAVTRTPGSFDAAMRGIGLLAEKGIPFVVKSALLPPNKDEMDEFEGWTKNLRGMTEAPAYAMFFDLRARRDGEKNSLIRRLRIGPEEAHRFAVSRGEDQERELKDFLVLYSGLQGERLFTCNSSGGKGSVDAYGNFGHCLPMKHPDAVFSLRSGSLWEALSEFLPSLRALPARNPAYLQRCARCFIKALCLQCPAKSWSEHGTLDTPVDYLCDIAHFQARSLGFLEENEMAWTVDDWERRVGGQSLSQRRAGLVKPGCSEGL